jgi:hypothetical protein
MSVKWVGRVRKIGPSNGMSVGSTEAEEPGRVDVAPASRDQTCEWLLERRFARRLRLFLCMCDTHSMVFVRVCMCSKPPPHHTHTHLIHIPYKGERVWSAFQNL